MKEQIIQNLDNPKHLEKLYRENMSVFKKEFLSVYPDVREKEVATFWYERLNYESPEISWGSNRELAVVILISLLAGFLAKLPQVISVDPEYFYQRNIGFIIFPLLTFYFAWKQKPAPSRIIVIITAFLIALIFMNLFPDNNRSDTLLLSSIHVVLFLWAVLGFVFVGDNLKSTEKRIDFLRYNGDLVVMTTLMLIAGILMTGITINLFSLIGFEIENFYAEYIAITGLAASPIIGTYIVQTNPHLVSKVSPVIAKIFSPLVLITLVLYLIAMVYSGKDPYNDREFLLIFNALLIGVMAIILFSVAETSRTAKSQTGTVILFLLSAVTVIVNGIALSAILFRISTWGISPNRLAVLGGNVLILTNLLLVTYALYRTLTKKAAIDSVEKTIADFLPLYTGWTLIVTFIFPVMFGFK